MSFQQLTFIVFVGLLNQGFLVSCCLAGYYESTSSINETCIKCPPGTYSRNCSERCPNGKYGLGCIYTCTCPDCDQVTGCPSNTTDASETMISADNTTALPPDTHGRKVFCIVSSTLGLILLFTLICYLSKRKKDRPTEAEDPYSFSNGTEYNTLQFAGLRRYNGANIGSASIYSFGQFGSDMPENGAYGMGITLPTVDEMRRKVTEGETNSPSEMDIHGNDDDNPYMNFVGSGASP